MPMELLISVCLAIAVSGGGLVLGRVVTTNRSLRYRVAHRMRPASRQTTTDSILSNPIIRPSQKEPLFTDKNNRIDYTCLKKNGIIRDLCIAGMRAPGLVRCVLMLRQICMLLPLILSTIVIMTGGTLSVKSVGAAVASGILSYMLITRWAVNLRKKRQKEIEKDLPSFLDLLVACVESGLNLTSALNAILGELDPRRPLVSEFNWMMREYNGGLTLAGACERLSLRCGIENLSALLANVIQTEAIGSSMGRALRVLSADLRDTQKQYIREEAMKMPVKAIFPLMMMLISIFIVNLGPTFSRISKTMGMSESSNNLEGRR